MKCLTVTMCLLLPLLMNAADHKWSGKEYTQWTPAETEQVLNDSPWVKHAQAFIGTTDEDARTYPVKGPSARDIGLGGRGVSDDNWDGGVGKMQRGTDPTLPVTVRWDSALPVREALLRSHGLELRDTENTLSQPDKYYVITVFGLAQARKPAVDESGNPSQTDPEQDRFWMTRTRQGLLDQARLMRKGKKAIAPDDARIDPATGAVQLFFPKTDPITLADKEVFFGTTFGSIRLVQKFRLKDMTYKGKLEL